MMTGDNDSEERMKVKAERGQVDMNGVPALLEFSTDGASIDCAFITEIRGLNSIVCTP